MSVQQAKRQRIHDLLDAQINQVDIARIVGVDIRTVRRIQQAKNDGKGFNRAPGSGGHNKKRTDDFLNEVKAKVESDPTISLNRLSKEFNVSRRTIQLAAKEDLAAAMEKRLDRCKIILNWLKKKPCLIKIFSDEKIFTVDQVYNRRNDRWLAKQREDVQGVFRTNNPQQVRRKEDASIFFRPDEKIDTEAYYKVLRYTQDGAPSHMAAKNQKFCKDNMAHFWPKNFWPPSSPDLNPLDFFWWGAIESKTNRTPHLNLDSLKATIIKEWANYPEKHIINACKRFRPRLEAVVKANGGHTE
ncbi:Uncharacterized protein FKW44_003818 [Caligus rogercresseyi]|uniref:Uncharacterized protein n=2 Tax=Caligus rogercresseyi TaxID=217165 RepID=A0A7T8KM89_CALRO|nr:Uncharacterized protein FKW44_003818 [Caligus rogercresseyi]